MVNTVYTNPTDLDLAVDEMFTDTIYDQLLSSIKHGGGSTGSVSAHVNGVAQSIPDATWTTLGFGSEKYDTEGFHSTVTNNARHTIPSGYDGKYDLWAGVSFASSATGRRGVRFLKNGATVIGADTRPAVNGDETNFAISCQTSLVATDYVEVQVFQSSGGALNVQEAGEYSPRFALAKV